MSNPGGDDFEIEGTVEYKRGEVKDFSKLKIQDGAIHYKLYRQDGTFEPMVCPDNTSNRMYVSWMQIHDRYTPRSTTPSTGER